MSLSGRGPAFIAGAALGACAICVLWYFRAEGGEKIGISSPPSRPAESQGAVSGSFKDRGKNLSEEFAAPEMRIKVNGEIAGASAQSGETPSMSSLTGFVKTADGQPVVNELVWVKGVGDSHTADHRVKTDSNGWYSISNIEPGAYVVRILAPDFQILHEGVVLEGKLRKDWVLQKGLHISGYILGPQNEGISGIMVSASAMLNSKRIAALPQTTDEQGAFSITGLGPYAYTLEAELPAMLKKEGVNNVELGEVQAGSEKLLYVLPNPQGKGRLILRVKKENSEVNVARFSVLPYFAPSNFADLPTVKVGFLAGRTKILGAEGLAILELPEGNWDFSIRADGFQTKTYRGGLHVTAGKETEIEVFLSP